MPDDPITLADYWMGRDVSHGLQLGTDVRANAARTVALANDLLRRAVAAGVTLERSPRTGSLVSSGWRPATINAGVPNAAPRSRHISGQAVDIFDPRGALDAWLMTHTGQDALAGIGLWLESPDHTRGWSHVQTVPPRSGRRVFVP